MIIWVGLGEFLQRRIGGKMAALAGRGWPALTLLHAACLPSLSLSSPAHQCNTLGATFGAHGKIGGTLHLEVHCLCRQHAGTCGIVPLCMLVQYTWRYIMYMLVHAGTVHTTRLKVHNTHGAVDMLPPQHGSFHQSWCTLDSI